ncbi:sodium/bile acid cotransporter 7-like isoform X1 [Neodiprion virginianus]|uniref:sodium/bile acid cotransporter 7-like isoform X1 n=1 Tax=Neodiprion virginianus TaxID=2961670 RepID=UPI001EE76677|nr:sodium/bile acid cotransporter 7-like isoform X1 [Neodiprion virginianus]XP_046618032.1 sodium/bile acid cotransporter 7-like isoform X1 [Neodiprion virginianus]XP_046618033.1 sodium/bile acid cotransporter 7-like isoform X1 [Neodiprion virginianus]XP_046618034.1 sodium/bile acid cotransporter 7-like isoform X1 [Neodiprion virginianus]XP_046618035.1 sodium/bile acid cotransporter 7-like isoform X1 [Neodiprion virginianus]
MSKSENRNKLVFRYRFFALLLICMLLASVRPDFGGVNGVMNGNLAIWYFAVPLTYLEAGLSFSPLSLYTALSNGYLQIFVICFVYILMPLLIRVGTCLLTYVGVNIWLLKGMEVLYCMPPPFSTGLVLSRLADADLPTSIVTTLTSYFVGLFLSPFLLYIMLGASTAPFVGINVRELLLSTLIPLGVGGILQPVTTKLKICDGPRTAWVPQGLLLLTAYHWFCDALSADASSLQAVDILLCILIACVEQLIVAWLCWVLCSRWLSRKILLAALFTTTHKSVGLGGWLLRGAYHGSAHGPSITLPLSVLPVAQLLLGSLLANWVAP